MHSVGHNPFLVMCLDFLFDRQAGDKNWSTLIQYFIYHVFA